MHLNAHCLIDEVILKHGIVHGSALAQVICNVDDEIMSLSRSDMSGDAEECKNWHEFERPCLAVVSPISFGAVDYLEDNADSVASDVPDGSYNPTEVSMLHLHA